MNRTKNFLSPLMAIAMLLALLVPQNAMALEGSGTTDDPYLIYNINDFHDFCHIVNGYNHTPQNTGACAKLMNDLDDGSSFGFYIQCIGKHTQPYTGIFDGNGHTIIRPKITNIYTGISENMGLFGTIDGATIKDLNVSGGTFAYTDKISNNTGTIVGYAKGASKILNVTSDSEIILPRDSAYCHIGGIVGYMEGSTKISGCTFSGKIDVGSSIDCIGGIVGFAHAKCSGSITNCFFNGSLTTRGSGAYMGGILGYTNDESKNFGGVQNCFSCGTLSYNGDNTYVNAIVGRIRNRASTTINNYYISEVAQNACNSNGPSIPSSNKCITIKVASNYYMYREHVCYYYTNPTTESITKLNAKVDFNEDELHFQWENGGTEKEIIGINVDHDIILKAVFDFHRFTQWVKDKKETCTEDGSESRYCTECNKSYIRTILRKGHGVYYEKSGELSLTYTYQWEGTYDNPLCYYSIYCWVCKQYIVKDKLATDYWLYVPDNEATCFKKGRRIWSALMGPYGENQDIEPTASRRETSSTAGAKGFDIPVLAHDYTSKTLTAEAITDGLYSYTCDHNCGTHDDSYVVKDFNGKGNNIELTRSTDGKYSTSKAISINDNAPFTSPVDFTAASVTFNHNIPMDGSKHSFIVPFNIPAEQAAELGTFYQFNHYENGKVYFDNIAMGGHGEVKANTAYFLDPAKDITSITVKQAMINATTSMPDAANPTQPGIYGTYSKKNIPPHTYYAYCINADGNFTNAGTVFSIDRFSTYLWLSHIASKEVEAVWNVYRSVIGDVNADGIVDIADLVHLIEVLNGRADNASSAANVDGNGDVNMDDVKALKDMILDKSTAR